jgi:hypothetical protein
MPPPCPVYPQQPALCRNTVTVCDPKRYARGAVRWHPWRVSRRLPDRQNAKFLNENNKIWRRGWDSNPRRAINPYSLSRGAPSAARPPLRRAGRPSVGMDGAAPRAPSPRVLGGGQRGGVGGGGGGGGRMGPGPRHCRRACPVASRHPATPFHRPCSLGLGVI